MTLRPRIADVQCSRLRFQPGDRMLVRSHHRLTNDEKRKLRKSILKWAGEPIEIFIYCLLDYEIEIVKRRGLRGG